MVEVLRSHHREHRPEDLFLRNPHPWLDVRKHSRLDEVAFVETIPGDTIAAAPGLAGFFLSDVDVPEIGIELLLVNCRPDLHTRFHRIPYFQLLRGFSY